MAVRFRESYSYSYSYSIGLNIAEGNGKPSVIDRAGFLDIACGSALESAECLDVLAARRHLEPAATDLAKRL